MDMHVTSTATTSLFADALLVSHCLLMVMQMLDDTPKPLKIFMNVFLQMTRLDVSRATDPDMNP
jgi:hypothetical protein